MHIGIWIMPTPTVPSIYKRGFLGEVLSLAGSTITNCLFCFIWVGKYLNYPWFNLIMLCFIPWLLVTTLESHNSCLFSRWHNFRLSIRFCFIWNHRLLFIRKYDKLCYKNYNESSQKNLNLIEQSKKGILNSRYSTLASSLSLYIVE